MHSKNDLLQLSPFFLFVGMFIVATVWFSGQFSAVSMCMLAIVYSFMIFKKPLRLNEKIGIFLQGTAQPTILAMVFIFILSGAFTYILQNIGATDCAINLGLCLIPTSFLLPGFFILISFFCRRNRFVYGNYCRLCAYRIGYECKVGNFS